jgi:uncharacterized membrane protein
VFGPLNGVRLALVVLAVLAAIAAAGFGYWTATLVLAAGIFAHGWLWLRMYREHQRRG